MTFRQRYRAWRIKRLRVALGLLAVEVFDNQLEPGDPRWDAAVRRHDSLVRKLRLLESTT